MVTTVYADTTALMDAIAASDESTIIAETLRLLGSENVNPGRIAGRVGLPALWGACDPHALTMLASVGRAAEWLRSIPIGPEPGSDDRRRLSPTLPMVQAFLAVADAVRVGLPEPRPALPAPLMPGDIRNPDGAVGEMRAAFAHRDLNQLRRVMMGYYATGADYRALIAATFATLEFRYPEGGAPVTLAYAGGRVLDMANWGGNAPALIYWLTPHMLEDVPDAPAAQTARAYAAAQEHDLGWLRTRLAIPKEEAAGPAYQRELLTGAATDACEATLRALRAGATPEGVLAGMALAAATRINAVPEGDHEALVRAGSVLLYVHAIRVLTTQVQDPIIWPLLYTASAAVNSLAGPNSASVLESSAAGTSRSLLGGGLIAGTMLRTIEQQLQTGDAPAALVSARRYIQMGHPTSALVGAVVSVTSLRDTTTGDVDALRALPLTVAAGEEYLLLPPPLRQSEQNPLLTAAIRLAVEFRGPGQAAERIRAAIEAHITPR